MAHDRSSMPKWPAQPLKADTDRPTREPSEHPDRIPPERKSHPVTRSAPVRRERVG